MFLIITKRLFLLKTVFKMFNKLLAKDIQLSILCAKFSEFSNIYQNTNKK